jgi:hypothetical protein
VIAKRRGAGGGAAAAAPKAAAVAVPTTAYGANLLAALAKRLADNPGLKNEVRANVQLVIKNPDLSHTFDLGGSDPKRVDATITIADSDLPTLAGAKADARSLFQHGKLRIDGDASVAQRLGVFKALI